MSATIVAHPALVRDDSPAHDPDALTGEARYQPTEAGERWFLIYTASRAAGFDDDTAQRQAFSTLDRVRREVVASSSSRHRGA